MTAKNDETTLVRMPVELVKLAQEIVLEQEIIRSLPASVGELGRPADMAAIFQHSCTARVDLIADRVKQVLVALAMDEFQEMAEGEKATATDGTQTTVVSVACLLRAEGQVLRCC